MRNLFIVSAILVFFVLGCSKIGQLLPGSKGGSNSPRLTSAGADPKQEIIDASKKFIALPAFSAKMEGMGQTEIKSQVDYKAPDRYHVMYLGGTGAGMEMIIIGNDMYMKAAGKWMKSPGSNAASIPTLRDSFTEEGLKTLSDVKYEGEDKVDGKPAYAYTYKNVTPKGQYPFSSKIWIGQDTGVPMKIVVDYTNGVLKQMTVNYDTESPVTIEPPIK
jgi:negative regulator of sigma E activity